MRGPLVLDQRLHLVGLVELLVPLVVGELEGVAGRSAIIVRRPALDRRALAVGPLGEEAAGPVEVVAVGAGGDQVERNAVLGQPVGEPAVFAAIIFGDELAAAAPALVADAPVADAERLALAVGRAFIGQRRRAGRCVAVFDPLLELLGRAGPDVGGEIRLDAAELAESDELVGAELVGLGLLAPAAEPARALGARADAVAPVILVGEAAARPADDDRSELADVLDQSAGECRRCSAIFESGPTQMPS